jgi:hypothetical protein
MPPLTPPLPTTTTHPPLQACLWRVMCLSPDIWKEVGAGFNAVGCCWVLGLPGKASRACACIAGCCLPRVCLAAFIGLRVVLC